MNRPSGGGTVKTIILLILLFPLLSYGQDRTGVITDENGNPISRTEGDPSAVSGGTSSADGAGDENLDNISGFQNTGSGGRENAAESASNSGLTQMLGMAMGAAFMSQCGPRNPMACALGVMSFIDAAASGGNKGNSLNFENSLLPDGGEGNAEEIAAAEVMAQEAQAQLQALEEMGFVANPDGSVNMPSGGTISGGDFASLDSLQGKGFSTDQAQAALDLLKSTKDKAIKEVGDGSGGGRAIASVSSTGGSGAYTADGGDLPDLIIDEGGASNRSRKKKGAGRMPAGHAAELSKNFHGTPIGVAIADLF